MHVRHIYFYKFSFVCGKNNPVILLGVVHDRQPLKKKSYKKKELRSGSGFSARHTIDRQCPVSCKITLCWVVHNCRRFSQMAGIFFSFFLSRWPSTRGLGSYYKLKRFLSFPFFIFLLLLCQIIEIGCTKRERHLTKISRSFSPPHTPFFLKGTLSR